MRAKNKKILGVGINDADYVVQKFDKVNGKIVRLWVCPYYERWKSILTRCYSTKYQKNQPTYKSCTICDEWRYFSKFKTWMETQDWEGKHLDKDLLFKCNKLYAPEFCIFITKDLNNFLTEEKSNKGKYPIGVNWSSVKKKFVCQISINGVKTHLGYFDDPDEAHLCWKNSKRVQAILLASEQEDITVQNALINRYI